MTEPSHPTEIHRKLTDNKSYCFLPDASLVLVCLQLCATPAAGLGAKAPSAGLGAKAAE